MARISEKKRIESRSHLSSHGHRLWTGVKWRGEEGRKFRYQQNGQSTQHIHIQRERKRRQQQWFKRNVLLKRRDVCVSDVEVGVVVSLIRFMSKFACCVGCFLVTVSSFQFCVLCSQLPSTEQGMLHVREGERQWQMRVEGIRKKYSKARTKFGRLVTHWFEPKMVFAIGEIWQWTTATFDLICLILNY